MRAATLKSMRERKLRTVLTALAIVLGVAMVTGALTLTNTMRSAADSLSVSSYAGTDAAVSGHTAFDIGSESIVDGAPGVPASTLAAVKRDPDVGSAAGEVLDEAKIIGEDGKPVGTGPYFGVGVDAEAAAAGELSPFRLTEGSYAAAPGQVVIDRGTAEDQDVGIGDQVEIATRGPARDFTISGIARFGDVDSIGAATFALFDLHAAQGLFDKRGSYDSVLATAADGVSPERLRASLAERLPADVDVQTAEAQDRFTLDGLETFVSIVRTALLAFGGIALLVGAFTIANTLTITVAQRSRDLSLMRTIGADRRQVMRSVLLEALVLGLTASAVGIVAGFGLAKGLSSLMAALGLELPQAPMTLAGGTVIASLIVGVGVTALAGLAPALRATRLSPIAALREGAELPAGRLGRHAAKAAAVAGILAAGFVAAGAFAGGIEATGRLALLGPGVVFAFVAVALLSPRLVPGLVRAIGAPLRRIGGSAGLLATRNAARQPGRTAGTASALMIGIALVTTVAVLGAGLRSTLQSGVEDTVSADTVLVGTDGYSAIDPSAVGAASKVPGVEVATGVRQAPAEVGGDRIGVEGVDAEAFSRVYTADWDQGSSEDLADLGGDEAIVTDGFASDHGLAVGDEVELTAPSGEKLELTVRGITAPPVFNSMALGEVMVDEPTFEGSFEAPRDQYGFVSGGSTEAIAAAIAGQPDAQALTRQGFIDTQLDSVDQVLGIFYVLLALAVIISLLGIVNTLALSVIERTREIGMLRAVGASRRQIRRMIRFESVITALLGAALGIAVGVVLAGVATAALSDSGLGFSVPVGSLAPFVAIAIVAGLLAAALPARRASRLHVLGALHYE